MFRATGHVFSADMLQTNGLGEHNSMENTNGNRKHILLQHKPSKLRDVYAAPSASPSAAPTSSAGPSAASSAGSSAAPNTGPSTGPSSAPRAAPLV
jgi:hypothetical protein